MCRQQFIITVVQIVGCLCTAEYELFSGFVRPTTGVRSSTSAAVYDQQSGFTSSKASTVDLDTIEIDTDAFKRPKHSRAYSTTLPAAAGPVTMGFMSNHNSFTDNRVTVRFFGAKKKVKSFVEKGIAKTTNSSRLLCPEEDTPTNIGPYEVPTQLDMVSVTRTKLRKTFKRYHKKALLFLSDMKKATRSTSNEATKCANPATYRRCVSRVSTECESIAASYISYIDSMKRDVDALTEGSICNLASMKGDPITLFKTVAMEEASLDFALPGFLRLLSACSVYCSTGNAVTKVLGKFIHATEDPMIKQFLTPKRYTPIENNGNNRVTFKRFDGI